MKTRYILFALPVILLTEIFGFSWAASLLRQQSDAAVVLGVVVFCALVVLNYYLFKFLLSKIRL